jgi:hypothetical protein
VAGAAVGAAVGVLQAAKSIDITNTREITNNVVFERILFSFFGLKNQSSKCSTEIYVNLKNLKFFRPETLVRHNQQG